jgi:hypothetical protein
VRRIGLLADEHGDAGGVADLPGVAIILGLDGDEEAHRLGLELNPVILETERRSRRRPRPALAAVTT